MYTALHSLLFFPFYATQKTKGSKKAKLVISSFATMTLSQEIMELKVKQKETGKPFMDLKGHRTAQNVLWQFFLAHWQQCLLRVLISWGMHPLAPLLASSQTYASQIPNPWSLTHLPVPPKSLIPGHSFTYLCLPSL